MFGVSNNLNKHIKVNHYINNAGMIASFLLFVFALLASFPIVPHTDIVEAITPVESETEIAMSIGKSSADLEIIPKDASGTFASSSASDLAEFNVTTNNYTGYTLGIEGTDDTQQLTNATNPTAKLDSILSVMDSSTFNNSAYNGKWGYVPSKYNSTDNVSFRPAPTTDGSILDVTNSANTADANTYTIGLGARVDQTKPTGTYTNTFILTAVGNPVAYALNYLDNSGDTTVSNMPATDSGTTSSTKVQISENIPTRTSFVFGGWCDQEPIVATDGTSTCPGTIYPASTASSPVYYDFIDQSIGTSIGNLYAVWEGTIFDITIKMTGNVREVTFNGVVCDDMTNGCVVHGLERGKTYELEATKVMMVMGLKFYWTAGENGTIANLENSTTTYTVGNGPSTITANTRNINFSGQACPNLVEGLESVEVYNETYGTQVIDADNACATVISNVSYTITANIKSGYMFSRWVSVQGQIDDQYSQTATYSTGIPITAFGVEVIKAHNYKVILSNGVASVDFYNIRTKETQTVSTNGATIQLGNEVGYKITANMSADHYVFTNWSGTGGITIDYADENPTNIMATSDGTISANTRSTCITSLSGTMQAAGKASQYCSGVESGTLTDNRDNNTYSVAMISNRLWMVQDLKIGCDISSGSLKPVTLTSGNSNIAAGTTYTTTDWFISGQDDNHALQACSSTFNGAWYNYAAATAGTITGIFNSTNSTYDICPSGWRLPNSTEINKIIRYYSSFNPVTNGIYIDGRLDDYGSMGYWWTSDAYSSSYRYILMYTPSLSQEGQNPMNKDYYSRGMGIAIRCIRAE